MEGIIYMSTAKRLNPTKTTLRDLYLKSGNQCAFPGCKRTILNDKGILVGQVCHIEAAMPGGERYNPNQGNEERRAFSNLMLLCYDHHRETNDVKAFTVKRLKKMKKDHEKKFSDVADKLSNGKVSDLTLLQEYEYCSSLAKMNKVRDWKNSEDELLGVVPDFNALVDKLRKVTPETRTVFSIMLSRSQGENSEIDLDEIQEVTGKSQTNMVHYVTQLAKYGFISEPDLNEYRKPVSFFKVYDMWDIWNEIKEFSDSANISLEELIVNMRFSLLD